MNKTSLIFISLCMFYFLGCASRNQNTSDDGFDADGATASSDSGSAPVIESPTAAANPSDDFNDFENTPSEAASAGDSTNLDTTQDLSLDTNQQASNEGLLADEKKISEQPVQSIPPSPVLDGALSQNFQSQPVTVNSLKYKANDAGGTVIVEATGPMIFNTRSNPELKQYIIEIPNSKMSPQLKRPLNTKDFAGSIGAIDAYQASGSNITRVVIQLREGSPEPFVQAEGNMVLIVAQDPKSMNMVTAQALKNEKGDFIQSTISDKTTGEESNNSSSEDDPNFSLSNSKILTRQSLADYLSNNTKFYGKKITVSFNDVPIRQAIDFFMSETQVNMIVDQDVEGDVRIKVSSIPWDQAFVTILRMNKLAYQRQGSILRVAKIETLEKEEKEAKDAFDRQKMVQPLKVKNFYLNFAAVADAKKQIDDLMAGTGNGRQTTKVIADDRTRKLIVQDTDENLELIEKVIKNIDSPIKQILVEAKIVEASETFSRYFGINWGLSGGTSPISGNLSLTPSFNVKTSQGAPQGNMFFGFNLGTIPVLGTLNASLSLAEAENQIKVVSSPRILTLSGKKASVDISRTVYSKSKTDTNTTTGTQTASYEKTDLPTKLTVTPKVSPDNFMELELKVEKTNYSILNELVQAERRSLETYVLVRDNQTVVLGGLYQTDESEDSTGVPGLKDIPLIGFLFKSKNQTKLKTELLIFLTPRVVNNETIAADESQSATF